MARMLEWRVLNVDALKKLYLQVEQPNGSGTVGLLYDRVGDCERALFESQVSEGLDRDDGRPQSDIGAVLPDHYTAVEATLKNALHTDPNNPDARENLGLVYLGKALYARAAKELRRVVELDPTRASAYLYLGEALSRLDEVDAALAAFVKSVKLQPDNRRAYYKMGILYDRISQPQFAEAMYRKAREPLALSF